MWTPATCFNREVMRRAHRRDGTRLALPGSAASAALAVGLAGLVGWASLVVGAAERARAAEVQAGSGPGPAPTAPGPAGGGVVIQGREPREPREVEDLRRQDLAALLAYWGVPVDWREHSAQELGDWRDRITAAAALRNGFAVSFDWQTTSLAELTDLRLRAAKSAEIAARYGVQIDWLRYSWAELEDLRGHVAQVIAARAGTEPTLATAAATATATAVATDKLAIPVSLKAEGPASSAPTAPVRAASISRAAGHDPDEIMAPTFGPKSPAIPAAKTAGPVHPQDPDAILPPSFGPPAAGTHPSRSGIDRRAAGATTAPSAAAAGSTSTTPAAGVTSSSGKK